MINSFLFMRINFLKLIFKFLTVLKLYAKICFYFQGLLNFRAPFSDTEKIQREIGSIEFLDRNHKIEIEIEESHGLASVKHKCIDLNSGLWAGEAYDTVLRHWKGEWANKTEKKGNYCEVGLPPINEDCLSQSIPSQLHTANVASNFDYNENDCVNDLQLRLGPAESKLPSDDSEDASRTLFRSNSLAVIIDLLRGAVLHDNMLHILLKGIELFVLR